MFLYKTINLSLLGNWFGVSVFAEMFENITSAILNFLANLCGSLVEGCINIIQSIGINTESIKQLFPALNTISDSFVWFGVTIALMLFILGIPMIFTSRFTDSDVPADSPLQLIARLIVSLLFCYFFIPLMETYVIGPDGLFTVAFDHFSNLDAGVTGSSVTQDFVVGCLNPFDDLETTLETTANVATFFIMLIFFIYLCILLLKFLFFHIQKFLMSTILLYSSPLAASTYVNKKTAPIWKNYVSLYAVNLLTIIFNIIVMKLIESGLSNLVSWKNNVTVAGDSENKPYTILLGVMAICAVAKIGKQMSVYIGQLFNINGMTEQVRASLGEIGGVAAAGFAAYNGINRMMGKGSSGNAKGANVQGFEISGFTGSDGKFHGTINPVSADTKGKGNAKTGENIKSNFGKFADKVGKFTRKTASDITGSGDGIHYDPNKKQNGENGAKTQQTKTNDDLNGTENKSGKPNSENAQKGSETSAIPKTSNDDKSDKKNSEYVPGSPDNYKKSDSIDKKGTETSVMPKTSNDNKSDKKGVETSVTSKSGNPNITKNSDKVSGNGTSVGKANSTVQGGTIKGDNVSGGNQVESVKVSNHSNSSSTNIGNSSHVNSQSNDKNSSGNTKNINTSGANTHSYDGVKTSSRESSRTKVQNSASTQTMKSDTPNMSKSINKTSNRENIKFDKKNPADTK